MKNGAVSLNLRADQPSTLPLCRFSLFVYDGSVPPLQQLRDSLAVLAAAAQEQLAHLERLELPGLVDEIALEYDDVAAAADYMCELGELTPEQRVCVKELNQFMNTFSGQDHAHLWTPEALYSAPQWEQVRRMATECLAQLK